MEHTRPVRQQDRRAAMGRSSVLEPAVSAGGRMLAAAASVASVVRRPVKPLHPHGLVTSGTLHRFGQGGSGVEWLDESGHDEVVVRRSRAAGLPSWLPDVHGLALSVPVGDGPGRGDLLFASTGLGRATRFTLTVARTPERRPMTTLLPYRSSQGPLLLAAQAEGPGRYRLSWARGLGSWTAWGELVVGGPVDGPEPVFDPVLRPLPGLETYGWVGRLREPAYRASRARRGEGIGPRPGGLDPA